MIQEDIVDVLRTVPSLGDRIYAQVAPDKPLPPYAVYARVASAPENTLADGQPIRNTRIQIDFHASSYAQVQAVAFAAQAALLSAFDAITQELEQDSYESEVKLHRVTHDYSIWHY